jgi:EpsI family protein
MRRLLEVYGLLLIVALACWPSTLAFHALWTDPSSRGNSHGYLVALVSLALMFYSRRELAAADLGRNEQVAAEFARAELAAAGRADDDTTDVRRLNLSALVVLLMLSLTWLVFWLAGIQDVHLALFPLIVAAASVALFGFPTLRVLAFPLAFFYFAEPLWEALTVPLQDLTVAAERVLLSWTDMPARIDGYVIRFPNGSFEIESGCSGLHFLVVGLAVAALYGELSKDSLRTRLLWLAIMGALALLSNWLRVFTVLVAGYQTNMRHYLVSVDHYRFGWGLFVLVMILFLFLTSRFAPKRSSSTAGDGAPDVLAQNVVSVGASGWLIVTLFVVLLPALAYVKAASAEPVYAASIDWPNIAASWTPEAQTTAGSAWRPRFQNATASAMRAYRAPDGQPVELFSVIYQRQRQNAEVVSYGNSLFGADEALHPVSESLIRNAAGDWRETRVTDPSGRDSLVQWRFLVGDSVFVSAVASQVWYGVAALRRPLPAALIAMRSPCAPSCDSARIRLEQFAVANCSSPGCGAMVRRGTDVRRAAAAPATASNLFPPSKSAEEAPHLTRQAIQ